MSRGRAPFVRVDVADEPALDGALRALDAFDKPSRLLEVGSLGKATPCVTTEANRTLARQFGLPMHVDRLVGIVAACGAERRARIRSFARCACCEAERPKLKMCTGCFYAAYCDTECSRADWPHHRALCMQLRSAEGLANALFMVGS